MAAPSSNSINALSTSTHGQGLYHFLSNSLILTNVTPHLKPSELLNLAFASRAFRDLIHHTPGVFRYLDLTSVKAAQFDIDGIDHGGEVWRNVQLDENLTEDEFYSGPMRGIFSTLRRRGILQQVQTLVLDGLSVTSDLCHEIINDPSLNVKILSIRQVRNLNESKLRGALQYACRPGRPEGTPKLKALYVFGSPCADYTDVPTTQGVPMSGTPSQINERSQSALAQTMKQDEWWSRKGNVSYRKTQEWAGCMLACQGIIAFDAVLCQGPRHHNSPAFGSVPYRADNTPAVATVALSGCQKCGKAPEGLVTSDCSDISRLPLLPSPPLTSSSVAAATCPQNRSESFVARCQDCLWERWCRGCYKWWCESCYTIPGELIGQNISPEWGFSDYTVVVGEDTGSPIEEGMDMQVQEFKIKPPEVSKSCWECGDNCHDCIDKTQHICVKCKSGYCIVHNEGSNASHCDWCVTRGRGLGRLFSSRGLASNSTRGRRPVVRDDGRLIHVAGY